MKLLLMKQNILILQCLCTIWLYTVTSGSLLQFKRDEIVGDDGLTVNAQHIPNNLSSFKYKIMFYYEQKWCKNSCTTKIFE